MPMAMFKSAHGNGTFRIDPTIKNRPMVKVEITKSPTAHFRRYTNPTPIDPQYIAIQRRTE
jgi:hypothetical protein